MQHGEEYAHLDEAAQVEVSLRNVKHQDSSFERLFI